MNVIGFFGALLSRREWVYLLSLLIPFVVYNLTLKALDITSLPGEHGLTTTLGLMLSDVLFNLGYVLFWVGLFAMARRGPLRWAVVFFFHAMTMLVVLVTTCAHEYFRQNGTTLDYSIIAEWIPKFEEIKPILLHDVPLSAWMLLAAALLYVALGPWLLTHAVEWWRGRSGRSPAVPAGTHFLGSLGLWILAFSFGSLSLLTGTSALARDPFVNLLLTGFEESSTRDVLVTGPAVEHPAAHARLAQTPQTEKRNVVLIHLESTRAQSVTPYNKDLKTTPFLDELAKDSLLVERAYVVVPRSSKASVAVNCGIEPPLYPGPEFEPGGIPVPCLASLLKKRGYRTVFFASTSATMDNFDAVAKGFGYEEFYSSEDMDTEGFQVTNTFGYEDDIMLEPSEQWLKEHGDEPFLAEYFTGTGHYSYECLGTRHGSEDFAEDDQLNRYLNCLRLQDIFLKSLFDQYKELGLYEEGLRIPLIIHAPGWFENGEQVEGLSNETDILPTVVEMLGFEVKNGQYPGYSLLHALPENRVLKFSCITNRKCLASIQGMEKYIYHYGDQPDEFFDLSEDPLEKHNLASERSKEELDKRREDLLKWRSSVNAQYG